jgi:hypothetical protein
MKERPILFSAPMVCAILKGRKTQTRRVVKIQPQAQPASAKNLNNNGQQTWVSPTDLGSLWQVCPYGQPGDRLWVRESFQPLLVEGVKWRDSNYKTGVGYAPNYVATSPVIEFMDCGHDDEITPRVTPSIFMPRWASRITLEITGVRVQRLQEISIEDALAEGITHSTLNAPRVEYQWLWDSINAKRGLDWDKNPWVWALTFKVVPA